MDAELLGRANKVCEGLSAHLFHDSGPVHLDSLFGNAQIVGDLFVQHAAYNERKNLAFPWGKSTQHCPEPIHLLPPVQQAAMLFNAAGNRIEEVLVSKGLFEEIFGSGLEGLDAHRNRPMAGDKDNGQDVFGFMETPLEIDPAQSRHLQIQYYAPYALVGIPAQELLGGGKTFHPESKGLQKPRNTLAN